MNLSYDFGRAAIQLLCIGIVIGLMVAGIAILVAHSTGVIW